MLAEKAKQGLALFGSHGIIVSVGSVAVAVAAILVAWGALKAKAQEELVVPIVKQHVEAVTKVCEKKTDELRTEVVAYQQKQDATNGKILELLHKIDKSNGEMKRDVEWLKKNK